MAILQATDLYGGYGGTDIMKGASISVEQDEIVVIIGPNGAGKSTVMKALFGLVDIRSGTILYKGEDITGLRTDLIVQRGIGYVPQEFNVFPSLTVHENLEMGAYLRSDDATSTIAWIYDLFPPLKEKRRQAAGVLSGGQRQMVAMGRALMLEPRLLMLDEPTAGLSPLFIDQIFDCIRDINRQGVAILMVEQNAKQALGFASRGYVLAMGANRHEDTGPNLLADPEVAEMFLGG